MKDRDKNNKRNITLVSTIAFFIAIHGLALSLGFRIYGYEEGEYFALLGERLMMFFITILGILFAFAYLVLPGRPLLRLFRTALCLLFVASANIIYNIGESTAFKSSGLLE